MHRKRKLGLERMADNAMSTRTAAVYQEQYLRATPQSKDGLSVSQASTLPAHDAKIRMSLNQVFKAKRRERYSTPSFIRGMRRLRGEA